MLPEGIEEILPEEARRLEHLRRRLLDLLGTWGYEQVMPPLIEYLDALLTGTGRDLDLQTFKITDQLTGRLMGVRADMTPQTARIDAHYLKRECPVRLCYVGNVLRTRPDAFAGSRELLQLGAELFGHPGPESDIEVARLMLAALTSAGLHDLHLGIGHVGVFRTLAAEAHLSEELENDLFEALQRKARSQIETLLGKCDAPAGAKAMLAVLADLNGGTETLIRARELLKAAPPAVQVALINLERVADAVAHAGTPVYIDLAELRGYRYYTGVVFSAFVSGQGQAVAQGGRYDGIGRAFGRARAATGFSTDLRRLLRLVSADNAGSKGILAPHAGAKGPDEMIAKLRAAGERVVVRLPGDSSPVHAHGCDRELVEQGGQWIVKPA